MIFYFFDVGTLIGVLALIAFCLIIGGYSLITTLWGWIILIGITFFWVASGKAISESYFNAVERNKIKYIKFTSAYIFPLCFMWLIAIFRIHKIDFCEVEGYALKGFCLLALGGISILLAILFCIINKLNWIVSLVLWVGIIFISVFCWKPFDDFIAKHDVAKIVTFETKCNTHTVYQPSHPEEIRFSKGDILISGNDSQYLNFTASQKIIIDNEEYWIHQEDVKIHEFISRYDMKQDTSYNTK